MAKTVVVVLFISCLILSTQASAQENEVSLSLGATFTPGSHTSVGFLPVACPINNPSCGAFVERFHVSTQISYQGLYARRFLQRQVASLYAELPVVGVPSRTLNSTTENLFGTGTNTFDMDQVGLVLSGTVMGTGGTNTFIQGNGEFAEPLFLIDFP